MTVGNTHIKSLIVSFLVYEQCLHFPFCSHILSYLFARVLPAARGTSNLFFTFNSLRVFISSVTLQQNLAIIIQFYWGQQMTQFRDKQHCCCLM